MGKGQGLKRRLNELLNRRSGPRAGLTGQFSTTPKYCHRRNAADAVLSAQRGQLFRVYLGHDPAAGPSLRDLDQLGSHHLTRPTPRGPKIHEHRKFILRGQGRELVGIIDLNRMIRQLQRSLAIMTPGRLAQSGISKPVASSTL